MRIKLSHLIKTFGWSTLAAWVAAQTYSIEWSTLQGVGGTASGANYTLSGTIGQPDAGRLSGTHFTLDGGFWPAVTVVASGVGPTLYIQQVSGIVTISWSPAQSGFALEQSDGLAPATWIPAPAGNPMSIPAGTGAQFYRLRKL